MAGTLAHLEAQRRYRESHREELREKGRIYARRRYAQDPEHAERQRERIRSMTRTDPEKLRDARKRSYEKHAEKRRAEAAAYRERYPERVKEWNANRDPEESRKSAREWGAANPDRRRENYRRWRKENPEAKAAHDNLRRSRKLDAVGSYTANEFKTLCVEYGNRCAYCDTTGPLTADHDIPLSRGGSNWISNIIPACKSCNSQKHARTASEFLMAVIVG